VSFEEETSNAGEQLVRNRATNKQMGQVLPAFSYTSGIAHV
jgi:hypothetical protein